MRFAVTLFLMGICMLLTLILLLMDGRLCFIYLPGASGDGIAEYSPLWLLVVEAIAAVFTFKKSFMGLSILLGAASALSIDIFQLFSMVSIPDMSLKLQAGIIILLWLTIISGVFSYQYFKE